MTTAGTDDPSGALAIAWTREVDTSGLRCPLPVLRARKALSQMAPGQVLRMMATDPAATIDVPHFCAQTGHALLSTEAGGTDRTGAAITVYYLRRRDEAGATAC